MTKKELKVLFNTLCAVFPGADVLLLSKNRVLLYRQEILHVITPAMYAASEPFVEFESGGKRYLLISLSVINQSRLLLCLPAGAYSTPAAVLSMIFSLEQAAFLTDSSILSAGESGKDSQFIQQLVRGSSAVEENSLLSALAQDLNIDLSVPRAVCVLRFTPLPDDPQDMRAFLMQGLHLLRSFSDAGNRDIIGLDDDAELLLCCELANPHQSIKAQCGAQLARLCTFLSFQLNCRVLLSVGGAASSPAEYPRNYVTSRQILHRSSAQAEGVLYVSDHLSDILFESISPQIIRHFLGDSLRQLEENPMFVQTLRALILHNMNMAEAAESLFIHRNTLVLRVKQIKAALGLDPIQNDQDRYAAILLYDYYCWQQRAVARD